jgi:hypothetical protein
VTDRAVSTVLDVSLCLLLVSAAVLTLVAAPVDGPDPAAGTAEELATTLGTTQTSVTYGASDDARTAHGSHAALLATAARTDRTAATGQSFREAVRTATRAVLSGDGWRGHVVARWRPYEASEPVGVVEAGAAPPRGADTHAATTTVPSGLRPVGPEARRAAASGGYQGVASVLADVVVVTPEDREAYVRETAEDLEREYDTPSAAARAVTVGRVRITVRTWSP